MKRYITPALVVLLLVVSLTMIGRTQPTPAPVAPQAWEYQSFDAPLTDKLLNISGGAGWELVTVATVPTDYGPKTRYFFKRPK
jgi:hypothetical protein